MIKKILSWLQSQRFKPSIISFMTNPFYFSRNALYQKLKKLGNVITGKTLDVGCGIKPYQTLFKSKSYVGMEVDLPSTRKNSKADIFYQGTEFPFSDQEFDSVLCFQVLEHVPVPSVVIHEINRVLKVGGKLLITIPFIADEHEQPHDYYRFTIYGIKNILENHGFEVQSLEKTLTDIRVIFQLLNDYFHKILKNWPVWLRYPINTLVLLVLNVIGEILGRLLPSNQDLYLDIVVLAIKK